MLSWKWGNSYDKIQNRLCLEDVSFTNGTVRLSSFFLFSPCLFVYILLLCRHIYILHWGSNFDICEINVLVPGKWRLTFGAATCFLGTLFSQMLKIGDLYVLVILIAGVIVRIFNFASIRWSTQRFSRRSPDGSTGLSFLFPFQIYLFLYRFDSSSDCVFYQES